MSPPLKVYGGNYDGRIRVVIAAKSGAAARRAMVAVGMAEPSASDWRNYYCETCNDVEIALMRKYGDVFVASGFGRRSEYTQVLPPNERAEA